MNRDAVLYTLIGLLTGFITGFMMHEAMSDRQPAPSFVGMAEQLGQNARPVVPSQQPRQGANPSAGGAPNVGAPTMGGAGNPQESMQQVQRLRQHVEDNPQDLDALKTLASLNLSIRNLDRATELFERYMAQKGDDPEVLRAYGNLSYDQQNWSRAAELYAAFLEISPETLDVRTDLGAVYRYMGRFQDALQEFDEVQRRDGSHWQALYNEVLVRALDLRDFEGAQKALFSLRALRPGDPEVERLAAEVERRQQGAG